MGISIRNRDVQIIFVEELTEHMAENAAFRCRREEVDVTSSLIDSKDISSIFNHFQAFFPRAYERRVLLIVGVCYTSSHLHIFTSTHIIFTSAHLHIFTSSHLHIFTSSHLHIIFTSSHLHIFTSTCHFHIFTSSHLHISSSHLLIFTSTHIIFTSSATHIIRSLSLSLSPSFPFLSWSRGRCTTKWPPFRTKWGSIVKNWIAI